ncbi:MAG TPA: hypothetical protein VFS64_10130 [Solirubrobacterales bacterium]|nr:hypothetical protein [Solirubrobacterales bacterium]
MFSKLRHPVRAIREPFGTAGLIVACVALVLALSGAAFAAGKLTSTQKKEVEKIAKKFAGKPGATGPAGPAGPAGSQGSAGSNGKDGANGASGKDGANGESVKVASYAGPECEEAEGEAGAKVSNGSGTVYVCDGGEGEAGGPGPQGPEGKPWTAGGTLPQGATETGTWALGRITAVENSQFNFVPVSFAIPLAGALSNEGCLEENETPCQARYVKTNGKEFNNEFEEVLSTVCTGTAAAPTAPPGTLCVYAGKEENVSTFNFLISDPSSPTGAAGAAKTGAALVFKIATTGQKAVAMGTWAVTGS